MAPLKRYGKYPPENAADDGESESDIPASGEQRGKEAVLPLAKLKLKHAFEEESGNLSIIVEVRERYVAHCLAFNPIVEGSA